MKQNVRLIDHKEYSGYFNHPTAYVVLVVFLVISGYFFSSTLFLNNEANMRFLFETVVPLIFLFFIPAITMGLISREKNVGTFELLTTLPLTDSEIVLGKFLAALKLVLVGLAFTAMHVLTIVLLGENVDYGALVCGYLGLVLLAAVNTAIGIFASSLTADQIVAFIIAFLITLFFYVLYIILPIIPSTLVGGFQYISFFYHLRNISRGVIDTRNLIYFITLTIVFLRLAVVVMESRKWR
jgi:ABC-2 type transport system permease protein